MITRRFRICQEIENRIRNGTAEVDTTLFHVAFAHIYETEARAPDGTRASSKLAEEEKLWQAEIVHSFNVAKPPETVLGKNGLDGWNTRLGVHFFVCHTVTPGYAQDAP